MIGQELVGMLSDAVEGRMKLKDFSFEFPARLAFVTPELEIENPKLSDLLNDDLPELCGYFEPEETLRTRPEYIDEEQFLKNVTDIFMKARKMIF